MNDCLMILMESCPLNIDTDRVLEDLNDIEEVHEVSYLAIGSLNYD